MGIIRVGYEKQMGMLIAAGIAAFPAIVGGAAGYVIYGRKAIIVGAIIATIVAIVVATVL